MGKTTLVIGDDTAIVEFVSHVLKRENIDVLRAPNGYLGIKMAIAHLPDVILSCHHMPYCSGLDVLKTLRAHRHTKRIPFISIFSSPGTQHRLIHAESGADAALYPPFKPSRLLSAVYELLKRTNRTYKFDRSRHNGRTEGLA